MSVHIENLHVGDWVTGCTDLRAEEEAGMFGYRRQPFHFDGMPWKVKAISAPFVVAERGERTVTLDLRIVGLTKLTAAYVRALRDVEDVQEEGPKPRKKRRIKTKRDPRDCPRCGQRMVQRIPNGSKNRQWHRVCPECHYDSGPVEGGVVS